MLSIATAVETTVLEAGSRTAPLNCEFVREAISISSIGALVSVNPPWDSPITSTGKTLPSLESGARRCRQVWSGSFTLLGAPIGPGGLTKLSASLMRLLRSPALLLLRYCVAYCKIVYTTRVTPPALLGSSLEAFDGRVRQCLARSLLHRPLNRRGVAVGLSLHQWWWSRAPPLSSSRGCSLCGLYFRYLGVLPNLGSYL